MLLWFFLLPSTTCCMCSIPFKPINFSLFNTFQIIRLKKKFDWNIKKLKRYVEWIISYCGNSKNYNGINSILSIYNIISKIKKI